jgi:hypothetical protein
MAAADDARKASDQFYGALNRMITGDASMSTAGKPMAGRSFTTTRIWHPRWWNFSKAFEGRDARFRTRRRLVGRSHSAFVIRQLSVAMVRSPLTGGSIRLSLESPA